MNCRKSILSAAIVASLGFAAQLHAQEAAGTQASSEETATELDRVVVTGIRASLQQSLDVKRNSDAIIDVITAEDVGKFPSTNVAEAMALIPGVAIDKAFGQGEKVSILGTDPALNRTLLNGQAVASADWYFSDQLGRSFNYSLLAPQLVGKVEVYKSPEAHIDEGSIGGTVIISTRKPLDLDGTTIFGQVGYLHNDRIGTGEPNASFVVGWKNKADNFGIIVSAQRDIENIRRDGIEAYGTVTGNDYAYGQGGGGSVYNLPIDWSLPPDDNGNWQTFPPSCAVGACQDTLLSNLDAVGPRTLGTHFFEQLRRRDTLSLSMQFKPHEKLDVEFNALDVKAGFNNTSHSMFAFNGTPWTAGLQRLTDVTVDGGVMTKATFLNARTEYDLIDRRSTVDTNSYDLKATWNDERWFASAHIGTTKAAGGTGQQVFGAFLNTADYTYDISGTPKLTFHGANPFLDPSAYRIDGGYANPWHTNPPAEDNWEPGWGGTQANKPTYDEEKYGQIDFGIRFDSPIYQVRFGFKQREHETGQSMAGVTLMAIQGYGDALASQFDPRPLPDNYLSGFGDVGDMSRRFTINGWALADYILGGDWLAPWQNLPVPDTFASREFVSNTYTVKEDISATYVQADYSWNGFRGNIGFRYVQTESDSIGWQCTVSADCTSLGNNGTHTYDLISWKRKYNDFLPNLNVAYDWNDLVFRFSAAKVLSRPNYGDMSNFLWLGPQTLTGGGGNPELDPYRSTNLDFSAEWYFSEDAILAGTLFHKDVGNYILVTTGIERHFNENQQVETDFNVSRPQNAGEATIKGLSLAYQQNLGAGFGILANYTYADAASSSGDPMPFNSEHIYSISPFFENDRWSARATYSYRSEYFTNVDRGDNLWTDDYASLDASLSFRVNDNLSIALDGMNLLDSEYYSYAKVPGVANTDKLIRGSYRTGRRYMATLRVRF